MNFISKIILAACFLLITKHLRAQKVVISVPYLNIIYVGLINPLEIAVEGVPANQLTVTATGCILKGDPTTEMSLLAETPGKCILSVKFVKDSIPGGLTREISVKPIPDAAPMFGVLESGTYNKDVVSQQNRVTVTSHFIHSHYSNINVKSYSWSYTPRDNFLVLKGDVMGGGIPQNLGMLISKSNDGDKLIIDNIIARGYENMGFKVNPISITIKENRPLNPLYNIFKYQKTPGSSNVWLLPGDTLFSTNHTYFDKPGLLKVYHVRFTDTTLLYEIKNDKKKILYEKQFYHDGVLKTEYRFEKNDSIGEIIIYYQNGNIKARGNIIPTQDNIQENFRTGKEPSFDSNVPFLDSFLISRYAPIGKWEGYYENKQLAFECNFILAGPAIPIENGGSYNYDLSKYTLKESLKYDRTTLYPKLYGKCKIYDREGKLISDKNY